MSIENNLKRIADALEQLVSNTKGLTPSVSSEALEVATAAPPKPVSTPAVAVATASTPATSAPDAAAPPQPPAPPVTADPSTQPQAPQEDIPAATVPVSEPTAVLTQEELNEKLVVEFKRLGGREKIDQAFKEFGANNVVDLPVEQYGALLVHVQALVA